MLLYHCTDVLAMSRHDTRLPSALEQNRTGAQLRGNLGEEERRGAGGRGDNADEPNLWCVTVVKTCFVLPESHKQQQLTPAVVCSCPVGHPSQCMEPNMRSGAWAHHNFSPILCYVKVVGWFSSQSELLV